MLHVGQGNYGILPFNISLKLHKSKLEKDKSSLHNPACYFHTTLLGLDLFVLFKHEQNA